VVRVAVMMTATKVTKAIMPAARKEIIAMTVQVKVAR